MDWYFLDSSFITMATITHYLEQTDKSSALDTMITQAKELNTINPSIIRWDDEYVSKQKEKALKLPFAGCPFVLKDNILLDQTISSFGSMMGESYRAPYSATVAKKMEDAGFLNIGKAAMDEFAMGSTGENSLFPIPHNAVNPQLVAGGSSSGSAVAVAQGMVPISLGTDTGGSVRLPAAFNGIIGLKPTYGAVSRYGVQAMASSFDQVGVFATTIADTKTVFDIIKWQDERDATSSPHHTHPHQTLTSWNGVRIGLPKQYFGEGLDPRIKEKIETVCEQLRTQGAETVELDIPLLQSGVAVYYTLINSEVSSNLARFDGLKFGLQADTHDSNSHHEYISTIRAQGFGDEVIRRILLWAHILSASEYEGLYVKAMTIRTTITQQFKQYFENKIDVILGPTAPFLPRPLGQNNDDPVANYLADAYTVIANLTGMPAISIPLAPVIIDEKEYPVGLQLMGDHHSEELLFNLSDLILTEI